MEELEHEIYSQRLLIFIETEPQSNQYHQILLNDEEFKHVSMNIGTIVEKKRDKEIVKIEESTEIYTLPDLKEIN